MAEPFDFFSDAQEPIPFDFENSVVTSVPPDVALQRAKKYDYALGPSSPGQDNLFTQIMTGGEDEERRRQATLAMLQGEQRKAQIITTLTASGKMDEETKQLVLDMSRKDLIDPASYLENKFAHRVTTEVMAKPALQEVALQQSLREQAPKAWNTVDYFTNQIFIKENIQHKLEEMEAKLASTPWLSTNFANDSTRLGAKIESFGLIPFLYNKRMQSALVNREGERSIPNGSFWSGQDIKAQADYYQALPPEQAVAELKQRADEIYQKNPYAAIELLKGILSFSEAQQGLKNFESGLDLAIVGGLFKPVATATYRYLKGFSGEARLTGMLTDVYKAVRGRDIRPSDVLETSGDFTGLTAQQRAAENVEARLKATGKAATFDELRGQTITLDNPLKPLEGGSALSREAARRLEMQAIRDQQRTLELIGKGGKIERLPEGTLAYERGLTEAEVANRYYNRPVDAILDSYPARSQATNTLHFITEYGERKFAQGAEVTLEDLRSAAQAGQRRAEVALEATNDLDNQLAVANRQRAETTTRLLNSEKAGNQKLAESFKEQLANLDRKILELEKKAKTTGEIGSDHAPNKKLPFNLEKLKAANQDIIVHTLGNREANTFDSVERANYFAQSEYGFKKNGYWVEPKGNGYVIKTSQAVDETLPSVRNALAMETTNSVRKDLLSWLFQGYDLIGNLRGTESTLSKELVNSFKRAGYGSKEQLKAVDALAGPVKTLRKGKREQWDDFKSFIEYQRTKENPDTGDTGVFSKNQGEFELDFQSHSGKLPTEKQSAAYWAYVRVSDLDWVVNNLGIYTKKSRRGLELFNFPQEGFYTPEAAIEGRRLRDMPEFNTDHPLSILFWNKNGDHYERIWERMSAAERKQISQAVQKGDFKAVQLSPTGQAQLRDPRFNPASYSKVPEYVNVVLSEGLEHAPLPLDQIPYKPGGHIQYDMQWYASQPKIGKGPFGKLMYNGDLNYYGFNTETFGRQMVAALNTARVMLKEAVASGEYGPLETFLKNNLPHTVEDLKSMFKGYGPKGMGDIDTPILLRPNHKNTFEVSHTVGGKEQSLSEVLGISKLHNGAENPHNLYEGMNFRYATERGDLLNTIQRGSQTEPLWNFRPARLLDPLTTMDRSAKQIMRDRYFEDLKYKTAESFIAEFGGLMKQSPEQLRENPFKYLLNPEWATNDGTARAAAMDFRRSALELIGVKTRWQEAVDYMKNSMADSLYENFGERSTKYVEKWLLHTIKSPVDYARAIAFQEKLGLFNPKQFLVQATGALQASLIVGPERAIKTFGPAQLMNGLTWTEDRAIIEHFASKYAPTFGMRREHFLEAYDAYKDSGFHRAGREMAVQDYVEPPGVMGRLGRFADWGAMFFNRGEEVSRAMGWMAAYQEWRAANPTARMTNQIEQNILGRADTLTGHQSAISQAQWQRIPVVSNITQFWNSQMRLAGLFWGRDLTTVEKSRLMLGMGLIYGFPIAGASMTEFPWLSAVRTGIEAQGIDPNENWLTRAFAKGGANFLAEWIAGTEMTTSETFGQQGLPILYRPWEEPWIKVFAGASGTVLADNMKSLMPLFTESFNGRPLQWEDFKDIATNISSLNAVDKAIMAMYLNRWVSKNGITVDKVTGWQGVFAALTGLGFESAARTYGQIEDLHAMEAYTAKMKQEYMKDFRRAYQARVNGDDEGFNTFIARANAHFEISGAAPMDKARWFREASQQNRTLVETVAHKYATKAMQQPGSGRAPYDLYLRRKENAQ